MVLNSNFLDTVLKPGHFPTQCSSETELIFFFVNQKLKVPQHCNIHPLITAKCEAKLLRATRFSVWSGSIFRQTHCVALTLLDIVIENHWRLFSNISDSGQTLTM